MLYRTGYLPVPVGLHRSPAPSPLCQISAIRDLWGWRQTYQSLESCRDLTLLSTCWPWGPCPSHLRAQGSRDRSPLKWEYFEVWERGILARAFTVASCRLTVLRQLGESAPCCSCRPLPQSCARAQGCLAVPAAAGW